MDIANRVAELRRELNRHNHLYYVLNAPEISDREFDMLLKELEQLERSHPELDDPLSPTHRVGSDLSQTFEQTEHLRPMLSLANTYSVEEVDRWVTSVRTLLGEGENIVIDGEMKFDGISISLIYENGRLVRAVTAPAVTSLPKTLRPSAPFRSKFRRKRVAPTVLKSAARFSCPGRPLTA